MSSGYYGPEDRRPPVTPQLAVRVATLGFIALALFAIIFFRLWFLQVLAGDTYLSEANDNRVRDVAVAAPRGDIVDRDGDPIVTSRLAQVVQLDPRSLPQTERDAAAEWGQRAGKLATAFYRRHPKTTKTAPLPPYPATPPELEQRFASIARVLGMRPVTVQERVIRSLVVLPFGAITLRDDVPRSIIQFLQERKAAYPGVTPDAVYVRKYPEGQLAAHLLGNVGQISEEQLKQTHFNGARPGTVVGQGGVEYTYDQYLRGTDGVRQLQVDSRGNYIGELARARQPRAGRELQLTVDLDLERAGQQALKQAMGLARQNGNAAKAGAFVAMNPRSGAVYAMGSAPSFDPASFRSDRLYRQLTAPGAGNPLLNRAVDGAYPTGSVFKPISALAAVQGGYVDPNRTFYDTGCAEVGDQERCNAKDEELGPVNLVSALKLSSDLYFYDVGLRTNSPKTEVIQSMARKLGLGRKTGIDVPTTGFGTGVIPDWKWREEIGKVEEKCRKEKGIPLGLDYRLAGQRGCGISDMRGWSEGDNANLAVGQGDVQASPLQMAIAYSAIVESGRVPTPHVAQAIADRQGRLLQTLSVPAARKVKLDPTARALVMQGLRQAASAPGGTSTAVWSDPGRPWDQERFPVYGKTGTVETSSGVDQSWYVCWIKDQAKPKDPGVVIAVTIEKGGFGAEAAAPAARLIASKFFGVKAELVEGTSQTN